MDYPGKVITKTQVTPTQTSASGNWTLDDQAAAIKNNNWPVALVPNPISKSLRFNSADSAYLNRTPASAGNRKTWTWSGWVKRSQLSVDNNGLFSCPVNVSDTSAIRFLASNAIRFNTYSGATSQSQYIDTTAVFRDVSAWYHVVAIHDTTQSTASDRLKIYVNGVQQAGTTTGAVDQNSDGPINSTNEHNVGGLVPTFSIYSNLYLTEVNFIDGQALTPSSFGMTNPQTGQWIPKKYTGTYGTNGFYLNFKDATSTTTLGYDYSGNANNWTTNNFSVTAGAGNDSLTDVPTPWFAYNTTGDVGGVIRGNYCTMNPLNAFGFASGAIANGNLDVGNGNGSVYAGITSTMRIPTTVPIYAEFTVTALGATGPTIGITSNSTVSNTAGRTFGDSANDWVLLTSSGNKENNNSSTSYGTGFSANDIGMLAVDTANGKVWFGKNGTWFNSGVPASGTNAAFTNVSGEVYVGEENDSDDSAVWNFGQRPFAYTPPTGFRSLCTTNLPATAIGFGLTNQGDDYFTPKLYTGTGSTNAQTVGFAPDFIWFKSRTQTYPHYLFNTITSGNNFLQSSSANTEGTSGDSITFDANGFTITAGLALNDSGQGANNMVAWNWKAGGTGVTNTAGTITSTVSASTTSGFSVVTYTGTGANATVGHGLGVAPSMIIIKGRSTGYDWRVYHTSVGNTSAVFLNTTAASAANSTYWNDTSPTSTVFSLGTNAGMNESAGTYVAYCFAPVTGYSAFSSYTGNGSADGPFVYTGFRPRFIMLKNTTTAGNSWHMIDTVRGTYNVYGPSLDANAITAEITYTICDVLSNGFKLRDTNQAWNQSNDVYVYMAFAESPFQFANAR